MTAFIPILKMKKLSLRKIKKLGKAVAFIEYNIRHPIQVCLPALQIYIIYFRSFLLSLFSAIISMCQTGTFEPTLCLSQDQMI